MDEQSYRPLSSFAQPANTRPSSSLPTANPHPSTPYPHTSTDMLPAAPPMAPSSHEAQHMMQMQANSMAQMQQALNSVLSRLDAIVALAESRDAPQQNHIEPPPSNVTFGGTTVVPPASAINLATPHIPSIMEQSPFGSVNTNVSRYRNSNSAPQIKVDMPKFNGAAEKLRSYIFNMERYLDAYDIAFDTEQSKKYTVLSLVDSAAVWYEHQVTTLQRDHEARLEYQPNAPVREFVNSWNELKVALEKDFKSIVQERVAFAELQKITFTSSMQKYNEQFNELCMKSFPATSADAKAMTLQHYLLGISRGAASGTSGATFISTSLNSIIENERLTDLRTIQARALLIESNLTRPKMKAAGSQLSAATYGGRPRYSGSNNTNWRQGKPNVRFTTPVKRPNFESTPMKLNAVIGDDADPDEDTDDQFGSIEEDMGIQHMNAHGDSVTRPDEQSDETEDNTSNEELTEEDKLCLNLLNSARQLPKLTPEEINRRRRNGTCFKCNRPGHFAKNCKAGKNGPTNQTN